MWCGGTSEARGKGRVHRARESGDLQLDSNWVAMLRRRGVRRGVQRTCARRVMAVAHDGGLYVFQVHLCELDGHESEVVLLARGTSKVGGVAG
eukprot:321634-Prorocentrum_minimum.AAC.1